MLESCETWLSYDSIKKQCKTCFGYHKKESKCEKKSFKSYIDEFKELHNPCFPLKIAFEDKFVFLFLAGSGSGDQSN